jgi:rhodanese-related sulfurtransferase
MWTSTLRNVFIVSALFTAVVLCSGCTGSQSSGSNTSAIYTDLTVEEFNQKIAEFRDRPNDVTILDVRTPVEFEREHLRDAINLDVTAGVFRDRAARLDRNKTYLVYDQAGTRSATAATILTELGFTRVYNLKGGITKWKSANLPTVAGS